MATLNTVINYARTQAQTDSNGLTDADGIVYANEGLLDFHRQLVKKGVDASQLQESYCDGVIPAAGNGSTFLYPTGMMFLKAIEVNYGNTNGQDYKLATQVDVSNLPGGMSFGWLRTNGNKGAPNFDDRGDWYEIFPSFTSSDNISKAVRLFYYLLPTEYSSVSDTVAYPMSLDYRILAWRIAANYYYTLGKIIEGDKFNDRYQQKVDEFSTTLARGSAQPIQATAITWTGFEF